MVLMIFRLSEPAGENKGRRSPSFAALCRRPRWRAGRCVGIGLGWGAGGQEEDKEQFGAGGEQVVAVQASSWSRLLPLPPAAIRIGSKVFFVAGPSQTFARQKVLRRAQVSSRARGTLVRRRAGKTFPLPSGIGFKKKIFL